jgi:hypothetical protein
MSLVNIDLKKLNEKLNYKPKARDRKSHEDNKESSMKKYGIKINKHKNKKISFLKNTTYKMELIEKYLIEKIPFFSEINFIGTDPNNCVKTFVEKYLGKGAEITRSNIKEAIRIADDGRKTIKVLENEQKKRNEEAAAAANKILKNEAAAKKKLENEKKKEEAIAGRGGLTPSSQRALNEKIRVSSNLNGKISSSLKNLGKFENLTKN